MVYRTILIVDDEESICQSLSGILSDEGYKVLTAGSGEDAVKIIEDELPDLVLLDIWLPGMDGIETLKAIKAESPQIPVVMMSGHGTIETAVKATKLGAFDFIEKPLSLDKVVLLIRHALEVVRLEDENTMLRQKFPQDYELTGGSKFILELKEIISIIAPTNAWILIMGENGTGKELVARSIHRKSKRSKKPFIEVNCAAIPEDLIESELFGHEKGSFTGATTTKRGKFDLANEGTIFLDEVADMSQKAQAKILRILQEKKFERVGGTRVIETDVRVLAATNKNLEIEMEEGRFRQDLFYRLNVIPLVIPPLRERKEDIPLLIGYFLEKYCRKMHKDIQGFSSGALNKVLGYDWPGNVRELENAVECAVVMCIDKTISEDLILPSVTAEDAGLRPLRESRMDFERRYLIQLMEISQGNISRAAKLAGKYRADLYELLDKYEIKPLDFRRDRRE